MALRLYTYFRSSAAYRTRIALSYKGLDYEPISVHLRRKEHCADAYRQLNPQALVPALDDDGTVIPQSLAIIEYLEEMQPEPALLPSSPQDRAIVRAMTQLIASERNLYIKNELIAPANAAIVNDSSRIQKIPTTANNPTKIQYKRYG